MGILTDDMKRIVREQRLGYIATVCPDPFTAISARLSPDCVFDASLVPETCPSRFVDSRELINKFLESSIKVEVL
jgi:hypothetical protein